VRCAAFALVVDTETALLAGSISCGLVLLSSGPVLVVASFSGVEDRIVVTVADDASVAWVHPESSAR
jgi:16S rRNA C1402 N4-methylase RsmH